MFLKPIYLYQEIILYFSKISSETLLAASPIFKRVIHTARLVFSDFKNLSIVYPFNKPGIISISLIIAFKYASSLFIEINHLIIDTFFYTTLQYIRFYYIYFFTENLFE